jgi:phage host-nuclease inhibitor protein Gam
MRGANDSDDDDENVALERTPAWIAAGRRAKDEDDARRRRRGEATARTIDALEEENARLRTRIADVEREFEARWSAEMAALRRALIKRDSEWTRRVERYRKMAAEARAAHEVDKASWAVERASVSRENPSIERVKSDVAALKASCRELRSTAELASRLVAPAVERALDGVRRALGD